MSLTFGSSTNSKSIDVQDITITKPGIEDADNDGVIDPVVTNVDEFTGSVRVPSFVTKQIGYGQFIGCACVFSGATIKLGEVVVDDYHDTTNKTVPAYALNTRG